MRFSGLFILLFLCSLSFAAVIWSAAASDAVTGVVITGDTVVFASADGSAYGADAASGKIAWTYDTGDRMALAPALVDDGTVAMATSGGSLVLLSAADGKAVQDIALNKTPVSLAAGDGRVFVGFNDSIMAFSKDGKRLWGRDYADGIGQIGYSAGTAYFVSGEDLYSAEAGNGAVDWSAQTGESFLSTPAEFAGTVYVGATDGKLYSFDYTTGAEQWAYKTGGWVSSTAAATSSSVYFGSNDGYFYSVSLSGKLNWKFKTGEAIWGQPAIHESNGTLVAVFGSNDGNIYAVDTSTGQQVWSFSVDGKPSSPLEYSESFIFGTSKGVVYSLAASPVCSFSWPANGEVVGNWSVDIGGTAHSDAELESVEVREGGGPWSAAYGTGEWYAPVDFSGVPEGAVAVECRAIDSSGAREESDYSSITLVVSQSAPLQKMDVSAPVQAGYNESFIISAKDSRGNELHGISVKVGTASAVKDSPVQVVLGKTGPVALELDKPGFEPFAFTVTGTGGGSILLPAVAIVAILALAYFLLRKRIGGMFPASIKK